MKLAFNILLVLLAAASLTMAQKSEPNGNFAEGELLVKFTDGTNSQSAHQINSQIGASVVRDFPEIGWQLVKLPKDTNVLQGLMRYQGVNGVAAVQPNYIYRLTATPNDTSYGQLYGMERISAPAAWDKTTGSQNVVVAVIDTGIRYTHEDLAANMWQNAPEATGAAGVDDDGNGYVDDVYGYDTFSNDGNPMDENGHGTHVAGTIGAVGNNSKGVAGVNWNVRLMAIKIYSPSGTDSTAAHVISAFQYVRTMRLRGVNIVVTNNSYGGCNEACGFDQATKDAIDAAGDANILNVFAAGNAGTNNDTAPFYPSNYTSPSILSVAASTSTDARASFSSFGATTVDVAAPGSGIYSTINSAGANPYGFNSGTSMASPHVAGAAALIAARFPRIPAQALKARLMNRVDRLPQWNGVVASNGRINVERASRPTVLDFDGDGRTDYSALQNIGGRMIWHNFNSLGGYNSVDWGLFTDQAVPADYDGDGITDFAVFRPTDVEGATDFFVLNTAANTVSGVSWGASGDVAQTAQDFDADGRADFVVNREANGQLVWYVLKSGGGILAAIWGVAGDKPVSGDFDADGRADLAVFRPSPANSFYVLKSSDSGLLASNFGDSATDRIVSGDFDGDRKTDFAVWRRTTGIWYWTESATGVVRTAQWGANGDLPAPGDYDGDGQTDLAVWRSGASAVFYVNPSASNFSGNFTSFGWGQSGMQIPAANFQFGF